MSDKYRKCVKCDASAFENPTLSFHSFPRAGKAFNYARLRIWAEYCFGNETEDVLKNLHRSHKLLCGKHFDRSAYTDDTMKKLNSNAVPNVHGSPVKLLQHHSMLVDQSVSPQLPLPNMPILVLPDPLQEPAFLEKRAVRAISMEPTELLRTKFREVKIKTLHKNVLYV